MAADTYEPTHEEIPAIWEYLIIFRLSSPNVSHNFRSWCMMWSIDWLMNKSTPWNSYLVYWTLYLHSICTWIVHLGNHCFVVENKWGQVRLPLLHCVAMTIDKGETTAIIMRETSISGTFCKEVTWFVARKGPGYAKLWMGNNTPLFYLSVITYACLNPNAGLTLCRGCHWMWCWLFRVVQGIVGLSW